MNPDSSRSAPGDSAGQEAPIEAQVRAGIVVVTGSDAEGRVLSEVAKYGPLDPLFGGGGGPAWTVGEAIGVLRRAPDAVGYMGILDASAAELLVEAAATGCRVLVASTLPFDRVRDHLNTAVGRRVAVVPFA